MSKIVIGTNVQTGKNISIDVDVLLSSRLLLQANSGKGKSYLLRKLCEQLFGGSEYVIASTQLFD